MNGKRICVFVSVALVVCLLPRLAHSDNLSFDYELYGTLLNSPATYSGNLTSGAEGTFSFTINDSDWPDPSDPDARFDYIWVTYFADNFDNSTPGAWSWQAQMTGTFELNITNGPPGFNGSCWGNMAAKFTIRDINMNAILDDFEKFGENMFDGRVSIFCGNGTGEMECKRGYGAVASNFFTFTYPPDQDTLYDGGTITLYDCSSATNPCTWGEIKALYR